MTLAPDLRAVGDARRARDLAWQDGDRALRAAMQRARRLGYTHAEIAAACNLSEAAVRKTLKRRG